MCPYEETKILNINIMEKILVYSSIYCALIVLYLVSFYLEQKFDTSKRRRIFVDIWAFFMIALFVYPLCLPSWWKALFVLSGIIIFAPMFISAEQHEWTL
jgi:hypothetical protein